MLRDQGCSVRAAVRTTVGALVGTTVSALVSATIGTTIRTTIRTAIRATVTSCVGGRVDHVLVDLVSHADSQASEGMRRTQPRPGVRAVQLVPKRGMTQDVCR